jgi:ferritin
MSKESKSFLDRMLAFVKSDDATTGAAMIATAKKEWTKRKEAAERSIVALKRIYDDEVSDLQETLSEKKDAVAEAFLNIDLEKRSKEQRVAYLSVWEQNIANAKGGQKVVEDLLKSKAETLDKEVKAKQVIIDMYTEYLAAIEDAAE